MVKATAPLLVCITLGLSACGDTGRNLSGSEVDEGGFGNATMNNMLVQTGQRDATFQLGTRFAAEVPTTITFAFNSAELTAEARGVLARQADWIRQFPELRFSVYGHADAVGSDAYNKSLGLRRAKAVVAFFAAQGISPSRLQALVSFGETRPAIPTPGPEQQNRRTVTEVAGFVQNHPATLHGKYAAVIFRNYIASAASAPLVTTISADAAAGGGTNGPEGATAQSGTGGSTGGSSGGSTGSTGATPTP